ncbi:MAG TPA: hypothetical protein VML19_16325, partial [Verrucomicrobiae bacterium]|nr:hypothetical protein [Verrucomicrobiae bacterium]
MGTRLLLGMGLAVLRIGVVDLNSVLRVDVPTEVAGRQDTVTVTEANPVAVETAHKQLGEVVTG